MAQDLSSQLVTKFMPILDEVYKAASKTAFLDGNAKSVDFAGANTVKVLTTSMAPLAAYVRETGYVAGEVALTWESLQLVQSRGREFSIDRMDNEETLGQAFGLLAGEFIRLYVAPELDAYRFAKYVVGTGNEVTAGTYTKDTIIAALDVAIASLNADSVPSDGRILFLSDSCAGFLGAAVTRMLSNENSVDRRLTSWDGMQVVVVPQTRFYQTCTINAGNATTGGFTGTYPLNFVILHPSAILQVQKLEQLKIFTPDENQSKDAWKFQYRIYHDAFVFPQKVDGIAYSHQVAA